MQAQDIQAMRLPSLLHEPFCPIEVGNALSIDAYKLNSDFEDTRILFFNVQRFLRLLLFNGAFTDAKRHRSILRASVT